jgi:endonuclease-3
MAAVEGMGRCRDRGQNAAGVGASFELDTGDGVGNAEGYAHKTVRRCPAVLPVGAAAGYRTPPVARESKEQRSARFARLVGGVLAAHPDAHCALRYRGPYQLLAATILSAQCTDKMVNSVTPRLFSRYPTVRDLAEANTGDVEAIIRSTGFFRSKARSLVGMATAVVERHGGKIPKTLDALVGLPGVGRKTANVILGNAFGIPGLVVDTHVGRIARRFGLTRAEDPVKVETALMRIVPEHDWTQFSHAMIFHGRRICPARKPRCELCSLRADCSFAKRVEKKER